MMIRLFFFGVALVTGAVATPVLINAADASLPQTCLEGNQDIKTYFKKDLKDIKWDYVKTDKDLEKVLKNTNHMIVIDVDNVNGQNVISGKYPLDEFWEKLGTAITDDGKLKGVKYNIKSVKAFKAFVPKPFSPTRAIDLPPFPQWFHINVVESDGQADDTVIDVFKSYDEAEDVFKCYTFSFGWGANKKCSSLSDDDISKMNTKVGKYKVLKKNLVIDIAHIPENPGLEQKFETITFVMDESSAKCSSPKSLADDMNKLKTNYGKKLLMDEALKPKFLDTHEKMCGKIQGFHEKFQNADLTKLKWEVITSIDDLNKTIEADIIKVEMDGSFFEKLFEGFINHFVADHGEKALMISFLFNEFEGYWNLKHSTIEKLPKVPIGFQVNIEDFDYKTNRWIDCYTPAFGIEKTYSEQYTAKEMEYLTTAINTVKSDERIFDLDLIKVSNTDPTIITELIKDDKRTLLLRSKENTIKDVKNVQSILRENYAKTFIFATPDMMKKVNGAKITELIPGIEQGGTLLQFRTVNNLAELRVALETPKIMIQVKIGGGAELTVKECIDEISKKNDNALKLRFSSVQDFTDAVPLLMYRNFPIWIHLDVEIFNNLAVHKDALTSLGHQLVLGSNGPIDITKLTKARDDVSNLTVTVAVKAQEYNQNKQDIDNILKPTDDLLIWMEDNDNIINSKDLRDNLKSKKYYLDIPNRFIMVECPANQEISDFSKIKISKYVESVQQLEDYLGTSSMIRAKIGIDGEDVYIHEKTFTLDKFLSTFETHAAKKDQGIIFTFDETNIFEKAMVEQMKTFNYPIWFDVNVFEAGTGAKEVELDYKKYNDFIDCRTLTLGLEIPASFAGYETSDITNLRNITFGEAKVYTIRADFLATDWEKVKALISGTDNKNKILSLLPEANAANFKSMEYREFINKHKSDIVSDFPGHEEKLLECPTNQNVESFFGIADDLSKMLMSAFVRNKEDLIKKLGEDVHMIRAEISKDASGLFVGDTDFTLEKFFEEFEANIKDKKKGIIFTVGTTEIFAEAMIAKMKTLNNPIWFEFEAFDATETRVVTVDGEKFNDILDCRTMLPTIKIDKDFKKYEDKHIELLEKVYGDSNKFSFRAEYFKQSWDTIEKLLDEKKIFVFMPEESGAKLITKDLRETLKKVKNKMFVDLQGSKRHALIDCPANQEISDFSKIKISKYVESEKQLEDYLGTSSMIRAKIGIDGANVYIHEKTFTLDKFLSTFETHAAKKDQGIIFTFDKTTTFEKAMVHKMKTFNYPIWFDVNVFEAGTGDKVVDLDYDDYNDFIDCRTLTLGLEIPASFAGYKTSDITNLRNITFGGAKVYTIRAEFLEKDWAEVEALISGTDNKNKILSLLPEANAANFKSKEYRDFINKHKADIVSDFPGHQEKLLDCPTNQDVESYFNLANDFSQMLISGNVKNKNDLIEKIDGDFHMIRAEISDGDSGLFVGEDTFTLDKFFEEFEAKIEGKRKGIIFTVKTTGIFDKAMILKMKTLDYPIWFDVNIYKAGTEQTIVDISYNKNNDILDCRTLALGLDTSNKEMYQTIDIINLKSITDGGAKVYTIRADLLEDNWGGVESLINGADNKNKILSLLPEAKAENFKSMQYRKFVKKYKTDIMSDFPGHHEKLLDCPTNQDVESFFGIADDLSKMLTSAFVQDKGDLIKKLDDEAVHMIRAVISKDASGLYVGDSAFTLEKFFEEFEANTQEKKKGIIFTVGTTDIFNQAMIVKMKTLNYPIWFEFEAVDAATSTPETRVVTVDGEKFNDILDCRTMLPTVKIGENFEKYEATHIEALEKVYGDNNKFSFRAEYLKQSWVTIKHLLDEKKIFVFMPEDSTVRFITKDLRETLKDVRNKIFVDLQGTTRQALRECPANNDFVTYFSKIVEDLRINLSYLRISELLKSSEEIAAAIEDKKDHMLSVFVTLKDNVLMISDVKLVEFLNTVNTNDNLVYGAKITFENGDAFNAAINDTDILEKLRNINRPIWIDAKIVDGGQEVMKLDYEKNNDLLDCRTLSLGWDGENKYSKENVDKMDTLSLGENTKIYVVELLQVADAWSQVSTLIEGKINLLTLLATANDADKVDYSAINGILGWKSKLLFDFPDVVRKVLHNGCGSLSSNLLLASLLAFTVMIFQ